MKTVKLKETIYYEVELDVSDNISDEELEQLALEYYENGDATMVDNFVEYIHEPKPIHVCDGCMRALQNAGLFATQEITVDKNDETESMCQICFESGFDKLYEVLNVTEE